MLDWFSQAIVSKIRISWCRKRAPFPPLKAPRVWLRTYISNVYGPFVNSDSATLMFFVTEWYYGKMPSDKIGHKLSRVNQEGCWSEIQLSKNQQGAVISNTKPIIWMFSFLYIIALWIISFSSLKCQALRKYIARKQGINGVINWRVCFSSSVISIISSGKNGWMIRPNLWPPTLRGKIFLLFTFFKKKKRSGGNFLLD